MDSKKKRTLLSATWDRKLWSAMIVHPPQGIMCMIEEEQKYNKMDAPRPNENCWIVINYRSVQKKR